MPKTQKKYNNFKWGGTHPFFIHSFLSYFTPADLKNKNVLDIGCGKGLNAYLIRVTRDLKGAKIIGMDINKEYLDFCKSHNLYDKLIHGRLPRLPFKDKSIDFLICTEVIEHLDVKDGKMLLNEIDRVCRGRVLITTPNVSFDTVPQEHEDAHHSIWKTKDFKEYGYRVYGIGFKVPVVHNDPLLRIKQALYYFFTPISYLFPFFSGILVCVKDY